MAEPTKINSYTEISQNTTMADWAGIQNFLSVQVARSTLVAHGNVIKNKKVYSFDDSKTSNIFLKTTTGSNIVFDLSQFEYIMIYGPIILKQCTYIDSENYTPNNDGDWYISGNSIVFVEDIPEDEVGLDFYIICLGPKNNIIVPDE